MRSIDFISKNKLSSKLVYFFLLPVLVLIYLPALNGPFLLDDFVNIPQTNIANLNWRSLIWAVFGNESGVFGRPISTLTFTLNHALGGTDPYGFKLINLTIHLVNTILVFILSKSIIAFLSISQKINSPPAVSAIIALIISAIWALHPLQVSTVMYVVQRMTLLMTTFTLVALILYLHCRLRHLESGKFPYKYIVAIGLLTLTAVLCKENGILILPYLFIIELTIISSTAKTKHLTSSYQQFFIIFSIAAAFIGSGYFIINADKFLAGYIQLDYTLIERLQTQPSVLLMYLKLMLVPDISNMSLYYDNFPVARTINSRVIAGFIAITILLCLSILARLKYPVVSLGLGIFFVSHLLESSFLPLEIAFEHRNYFALYGITIAAAGIFHEVVSNFRLKNTVMIGVLPVVAILAFQTHIRAAEWSDELLMNSIAVQTKPTSSRARSALAISLSKSGQHELAVQHLDIARKTSISDAYYSLAILQIQCIADMDISKIKKIAQKELTLYPISISTISALGDIYQNIQQGFCKSINLAQLGELYQTAIANPVKRTSDKATLILEGNYAGILLSSKGVQSALSFLENTNIENSSNSDLQIRMAWLYAKNEQFNNARKYIELVKNSSRGKLGAHDESLARLERLIPEQPGLHGNATDL